jgi:hypothetical protein
MVKNQERREVERCQEQLRRVAEQARRQCEHLEELERLRVSGFESLARPWEKAWRLMALIDAVTEAVCREVAIEAEDGFARWLKRAGQHLQAIDPLAISPTAEVLGPAPDRTPDRSESPGGSTPRAASSARPLNCRPTDASTSWLERYGPWSPGPWSTSRPPPALASSEP